MIPSVPSGHRISRVLPIRRRHEGHKVPPTRDSRDPISMVLRTSTGAREVPPVSIRRASKDSTRPAVDRCIRPTDRRKPAKDDRPRRRRVPPLPEPEPTRTVGEATEAVRIRHRPSSDPTSSSHHPVKGRAKDHRRRHRPGHPEPEPKVRDHPVGRPVPEELPVPRVSPWAHRPEHRVPREGIPERHRSRRNRTTTDKISPTNLGGIPTLRRTSNRTRPTSNDRCIPVVGKARASTVASIPRRARNPSPASGARTTVRRGQPDHPVPVCRPVDLRGHRISGTRGPIRRQRTGIRRGRDRSSSSNRRIRPINSFQGQQQPWNQMPPTSQQGGSPLRPPPRGGKPFASSMQASGPGGGGPGMPPQPGMPPTSQPQQPPQPGVLSAPPQAAGAPVSAAKPIQPPGFPPPASSVAPKRDIVFPVDSVESTAPILYKRKRVSKMDIGQTDPWRIFMALRSGLLVESTWALDVLNILLFDDSSVSYFGLSHLPGLLNLLLDHFQKSLSDMFDTKDRRNRFGRAYGWFGKEVVESEDEEEEEDEKKAIESVEVKKEVEDEVKLENGELDDVRRKDRLRGSKRLRKGGSELDLGAVLEVPSPDERIVVFNATTNYTMSSRKGLPVKIQPADDDVFVLHHRRDWDRTADDRYHRETDVGGDPWTAGHSDPDPHDYIMDAFQAEFVNIPFARMIKTSRKYKARCKNNNNNAFSNANTAKKMQKRGSFVTDSSGDESDEGSVPQANGIVNGAADSGAEEDCKATVKKEPSADADCREIDMELEKGNLSNGPQQEEAKEVKMEIEEDGAGSGGKVKVEEKKFNVAATVRDPARVLKRRKMSDYEDECYTRDEASLYLVTEGHDALARRCVAISNILRNLSFVPGNETEFARSSRFLSILGKLLLLHHEHPVRTKKTRNYDREEDADFSDSCSSLQGESEWWWDFLVQIRENMLVSMANLAGQLDLSRFDEPISRPILDGLLHWSVCPSAHGQDPFPTLGPNSVLSPQRLALEALCKLCVTDANVDLVIATPPFSRLEKLCSVLTRHLCKNEDQVLREFSVNLLHYLAAADSAMARTVAMQSPCVSYLVAFIEQAEQTALGVANQHGINYLRDNPDSMGTSLDMLRRAAGTLLHLAKHPDNRPLFMQQEQRLLGLVMSHILDQQVALIISRVLFQCSRGTGPLTTMEIESNPPNSKKAASTKSSLHLNSIISPAPASSMAPPPPAAAPSGNTAAPKSSTAPDAPLTQLTSMPAPAAPVNSAPPAFVPPPPPPAASASVESPSPAAPAAAPAPPQHPITASS